MIDRDLDLEDLYTTPDDGNRYEILDGAIVMTPPPNVVHQQVSMELSVLLHRAIEGLDLRILAAPVAWRIGPGQVPEPDLIVASPAVLTTRAVEGPPLAVVEVVSPSGRGRDLYEKRRIYAEGRAQWYWIVDPTVPSLTALRLANGTYEEDARATGDEAYETHMHFAVRVVPAELTR